MLHSRWPTRIGLALLTAAVPAGVITTPAEAAGEAGSAYVSATTWIQFAAAEHASSRVVITRKGNTVTIDDRAAIRAGDGCKQVKGDKTRVRCTTRKPPTRIRAKLLDKNDSITNKTSLPLWAYGSTGNDTINGGTAADVIDSGPGNDTVNGGAGNDTLDAGTGNDTLDGGTGNDFLDSFTGNDTVRGGDGDDTINKALRSNDTGQDRLYGGNGYDIIQGSIGNDTLDGGNGPDELHGGNGSDTLYGGPGSNTFTGGLGNDRMYGGPDHDHFYESGTFTPGKPDADLFVSGGGNDGVSYFNRQSPVTMDADGQTGDDGSAGEHDTIGVGIRSLIGGDGNDTLYTPSGNGYLDGGPGNDVLYGNNGNDFLYGGFGNDRITAGAGNDHLDGGLGDDHLDGQDGDDNLIGDRDSRINQPFRMGADTLIGGTGTDQAEYLTHGLPIIVDLDGETGDDGAAGEHDTIGADVENVIGTSYDDQITGNAADNRLQGYGGVDTVYGLDGDDNLIGGDSRTGSSRLYGGNGDDTLWGHAPHQALLYLDGGDDATSAGDLCILGPVPDHWINCERF